MVAGWGVATLYVSTLFFTLRFSVLISIVHFVHTVRRLYLDQLPERLSSLEVQNAKVAAVSGRGGGGESVGEGTGAGGAGARLGKGEAAERRAVEGTGAGAALASLARLAGRIYNVAMMKGVCVFQS